MIFPEPMLALAEKDFKKPFSYFVENKYLIQEKLDGVRALIVSYVDPNYYGQVIRVFGRGEEQIKDEKGKKILGQDGKPLTKRSEFTERVPEIIDFFKGYEYPFMLDVELMSTDFAGVQSKVGTKKFVKHDPNFFFTAFDLLQWAHYDYIEMKKPYHLRFAELIRFRDTVLQTLGKESDLFQLVKTAKESVQDEAHIEKALKAVVKKNGEGLILKNPDSLYQPGKRNKDWVKILPYRDLDVIFTGVFEGKGKYKGTLGGFHARSVENPEVTFDVGTGFDDEFRHHIWNQSGVLFPAAGKIKYKDLNTGIPRMPVFLQFTEKEVQ